MDQRLALGTLRRYASELYCDVEETTYIRTGEEPEDRKVVRKRQYTKIRLGRLPMMLKSEYCWLKGLNQKQLVDLGECVYDQGGSAILAREESQNDPSPAGLQTRWLATEMF